jgi:PUA-domain protein
MKKRRYSGKEVKELDRYLEERYGLSGFVKKKDKVELIDEALLTVNGENSFLFIDDDYVPTLKVLLANDLLKKVVVDMPAVKFMVNGADVMRPGIKEMGEFKKGDYVVIVDETHGKPLAVGKALFSYDEISNMEKGKVIKNLHYVGDWIWEL